MEQNVIPWLKELMDGVIPHLRIHPKARDWAITDSGQPIYHIDFSGSENGHGSRKVEADGLGDLDKLNIRVNGEKPNGFKEVESEVAPVRVEDALEGKAHEVWKPDDWVWATLLKNERVTKEGWWQDVREIELDFEDPST